MERPLFGALHAVVEPGSWSGCRGPFSAAEGDRPCGRRVAVADEDGFRKRLTVDLSLSRKRELERRDEFSGARQLDGLRAVVGVRRKCSRCATGPLAVGVKMKPMSQVEPAMMVVPQVVVLLSMTKCESE